MGAPPPIPILLYHKLGHPPRGARVPGHYVSPRLFRRHLAFLRARGYEGVPLTAFLGTPADLPAKPMAITFDDGYRCLREHALPALAEHGFPATIFLVTGGLGKENYWETAVGDVAEPMLTPQEVLEMRRAGLAFGSHTVNHPHLTGLDPDEVQRELAESRAGLEQLLGEPCLTLAYPYGDWDPAVRDAAEAAGYRLACTTVRASARPDDDRLALPRLNIRRYNLLPRFAYKLWRGEQEGPVSDRLRILQYITPSGIGGAELHVAALAEKLRERGHDVLVICPQGRPLLAELEARYLPVRAPRTYGKFDPVTLARLTWWLRRDPPHVLHTHLSTASLLGSAAARLAGVPSVATVHGLNTRTCFNWAPRIIAVSHAVKLHLVSQGLPEGRITVIHNGVDLQHLSRAYDRAALRRAWRLPESAPVLVTVGRLAPQKGHHDLLRALALLSRHEEWRELRLLVVGAGALAGPLQTEAAELGLSPRVVFAGFQRDVPPFVQAADIFVLPSLREGLSLSALEAMALAKPVVACRVGGTPEVVEEGKTGLLVSPGRPEELAEALDGLLRHPEQVSAMGQAGARRVREAFDLEQMVCRIEGLYRTLATGGAAAAR